jgi:hypothetical protein
LINAIVTPEKEILSSAGLDAVVRCARPHSAGRPAWAGGWRV